MAADNQRQIDSRRDALRIDHRIPLGRNFGFKAHVEILFPADDGVIRAAESDKRMPFAQQIGDGRKLLFQFGIHPVYVADKPNIPKPRAFHQRGQQLSVLLDVIGQRRFSRSLTSSSFCAASRREIPPSNASPTILS